MSAALLCLQCNGRQNGFARTFLQEKCASTHTPRSIKRSYLKSAISVRKEASGVYYGQTEKDLTESLSYHESEASRLHGKLQSPTRMPIHTLITRQRERRRQQTEQLQARWPYVHRAFQDPPLHCNCNRDRWFME